MPGSSSSRGRRNTNKGVTIWLRIAGPRRCASTRSVPEAGWVLIDLLDKEGRQKEAHRLGMRLHEIEPDPRDRVRILLEMSRLDIEAREARSSRILLLEPVVKQHPENLPLTLALGRRPCPLEPM